MLDEELKLKPIDEAPEAKKPKKKETEQGAALQRKAADSSTTLGATPPAHDVLAASGRPLDAATRGYMEARFGHDD